MARTKLKMIGTEPDWEDKYVYVSFTNQVPGVDVKYTNKKLYYRTVPSCYSKVSIPFWRAKGVLKMNGSSVPFLIPWNRQDSYEIHKMLVQITDDEKDISAYVQTDYIFAD